MAYPMVILFQGSAEEEIEEQEQESVTGEAHEEEPAAVSNPILPTGNELIFSGVFFVLLWILMKFVLLPPVVRVMDQRSEKIRGDLAAAEEAKGKREALVSQYEAALGSARTEATRLIEDARAQADTRRAELLAAAEADVAAAKAAAAAEVATAKATAMAELRGQVAGIATAAAEAVVQRPVDPSTSQALIEQYLSQTGSQN